MGNRHFIALALSAAALCGCGQKWTESAGDGYNVIEQKGGPTLGYNPESGITILHQDGYAYTQDNIDALLTVRAESARLRRSGVRLHRTSARKPAQDRAFSDLLCRILSENTGA